MTNERSTDGDEANSVTSRRRFLKGTGAIAGPVIFSETVRSKSNGGRPLVVEVKTGYRLPDGLPDDDDVRPALNATCSPPSYHVKEDRLQVTPTASEEEVDILKNNDKIVVSDGISAFSPPIWGETEKYLRLNPKLGVRQVDSLTLSDGVQSPEVQLGAKGDKFELKKPNGGVSVGTQQANSHRLPSKTVKVTGYRVLDSEQTRTSDGTPSAERAPPKEKVEFDIKAIPEVHIKNHGRLAVEKLSIGDTVNHQ